MKSKLSAIILGFLSSTTLFAGDVYQLTLVDTTIDGLVRANSVCDQYLMNAATEHTKKIDGLALRSVQAWKKKNTESNEESLLLKIALMPTRCIEVNQETPKPPAKKGYLLNNDGKLADPFYPKGIRPDPEDFVVGVGGTRGMVSVQMINGKRTNNYYGPYSTSNYYYDEELKTWAVNLEWKMKDLMTWYEYRFIYGKKDRDLNIYIPLAYCPKNFSESEYRPRIAAEETTKWDRLFKKDADGKESVEPSRCLTFPQPLKVNLNVDLDNNNTPLPIPSGKFLELKNIYETSVLPSNEDKTALNKKIAGFCYDRRDSNVPVPAVLVGKLTSEESDSRLQLLHLLRPSQDPKEIDKIIEKAFSLNGHTSFVDNNALKSYENDFRTISLRKSDKNYYVKVEDTVEAGKLKFEKNEVRFCEFLNK